MGSFLSKNEFPVDGRVCLPIVSKFNSKTCVNEGLLSRPIHRPSSSPAAPQVSV